MLKRILRNSSFHSSLVLHLNIYDELIFRRSGGALDASLEKDVLKLNKKITEAFHDTHYNLLTSQRM